MSIYLQFLAARALGRQPAIRPPRRSWLSPPDGALPDEAASSVTRTAPPRAVAPQTEIRNTEAPSVWTRAHEPTRFVAAPGLGDAELLPSEAPAPQTLNVPIPLKMPGREDVPADHPPTSFGQMQSTGNSVSDRNDTERIPSIAMTPPLSKKAPEAAPPRLTPRQVTNQEDGDYPTVRLAGRPAELLPPRRDPSPQPEHGPEPAPESAPATYIHIGRIELHAATPAVTVRRASARPAHQHMSLDEYLRRRDGRSQ